MRETSSHVYITPALALLRCTRADSILKQFCLEAGKELSSLLAASEAEKVENWDAKTGMVPCPKVCSSVGFP